jgi:hypothetical protein
MFRPVITAHISRNIVLNAAVMKILRDTIIEYVNVGDANDVDNAKCWTLFVAYIISSLKTTQLSYQQAPNEYIPL